MLKQVKSCTNHRLHKNLLNLKIPDVPGKPEYRVVTVDRKGNKVETEKLAAL